ncbi:MAG: hypothetical protein NZ700_14845 [Gemmataceae bacterium]|nr:hypothetical protein [Gemmataceae bacterium]MDW8264349.1 hypothetical protein [Gemmataceae bacterium]
MRAWIIAMAGVLSVMAATSHAQPPATPAAEAPAPVIEQALRELEGALPAPAWVARLEAWDATMIRQVAEMLGQKERAEKILLHWVEGRLLRWTSVVNGNQEIGVGVMRFKDTAAAKAYMGLAADLQRKLDEKLVNVKDPGLFRLESVRPLPVRLRHADDAVGVERRFLRGGEPYPASTVLARSGPWVVEITWQGLPMQPEWNDWLMSRLHGRLGRR